MRACACVAVPHQTFGRIRDLSGTAALWCGFARAEHVRQGNPMGKWDPARGTGWLGSVGQDLGAPGDDDARSRKCPVPPRKVPEEPGCPEDGDLAEEVVVRLFRTTGLDGKKYDVVHRWIVCRRVERGYCPS